MEFSFPCVGSIDDGIFDLGLDDDSYDDTVQSGGRQSRVLSPDALDQLLAFNQEEEEGGGGGDSNGGTDKTNALAQSPFCDAAIASPVSEALAAAHESKAMHPKDKGQDSPLVKNKNSAVVQVGHRVLHDMKTSLDCALSMNKRVDAGPIATRDDTSPLVSPIRWPPPRETRAGAGGAGAGGSGDISNAFPPRLPVDGFDGPPTPISAGATRLVAAKYRGTKAQSSSRRFPARNALDKPQLAEGASAQSRWAQQRAATCEAAVVAASVRKEEEALAEASTAIAVPVRVATCASEAPNPRAPTTSSSSGFGSGDGATKHNVTIAAKPVVEKRKVSFAGGPGKLVDGQDDDGNDDDDVNLDDAVGDRKYDDHHSKNGKQWRENTDTREGGGEVGAGEQDEDLLARASDLHSSVAGQLRSVNELLKRKSYIYIDTSWSAKQLPCPPTAWKGKSVGAVNDTCSAPRGGASEGGAGIRIETSASDSYSTVRSYPSTTPGDRPPVAFSSDANNVVVRLEGRWVSAGPNKTNVGFHSIPGEKVHDPSWRNQDAGLVVAPLDRKQGQALFAIFDGHGKNGRRASRECMDRLPKYLVSTSRSGNPASALRRSCQQLHRHLASGAAGDCTRSGTTLCAAVLAGRRLTVANVGDSGCLRLSYNTAFAASNPLSHDLISAAATDAAADTDAAAVGAAATFGRFDIGISGGDHDVATTTGSKGSGRRRARAVHKATASVGEAGARPRGRNRGGLVAQRLSRDHKPENRGERERIQAAGGIVFPLPRCGALEDGDGREEGGVAGELLSPAKKSKHRCQRATGTREQGLATARDFGAEVPRVWAASGEGPGLAMSRSIGDKMAHGVGVSYEPEITEIDLDPRRDVMLVLASDGVWDVLSAEDVRKTAEAHAVEESWCPQALSMDICRKSLSQWTAATTGGSDDITCLIVKTGGGALPPPISTRVRRKSPSVAAADAA